MQLNVAVIWQFTPPLNPLPVNGEGTFPHDALPLSPPAGKGSWGDRGKPNKRTNVPKRSCILTLWRNRL